MKSHCSSDHKTMPVLNRSISRFCEFAMFFGSARNRPPGVQVYTVSLSFLLAFLAWLRLTFREPFTLPEWNSVVRVEHRVRAPLLILLLVKFHIPRQRPKLRKPSIITCPRITFLAFRVLIHGDRNGNSSWRWRWPTQLNGWRRESFCDAQMDQSSFAILSDNDLI